jgi:hypothetical protein
MCKICDPSSKTQARTRESKFSATLVVWAKKGLIPMYNLWNKQNPMADLSQCGSYRPDFVYEWAEGVLLLEYEKKMHSDRVKRCELVRMAEVSLGYGGRPVFWIRYNPDEFKVVGKSLRTSAKQREAVLLKMLQDMIGDADYDHFMTIRYACYHKPAHTEDNLVQTLSLLRCRPMRRGSTG